MLSLRKRHGLWAAACAVAFAAESAGLMRLADS